MKSLIEAKDHVPTEPVPTAEIERPYAVVVSIASTEVHALILDLGNVLVDIWNANAAMSGIERTEAQTGRPAEPAA